MAGKSFEENTLEAKELLYLCSCEVMLTLYNIHKRDQPRLNSWHIASAHPSPFQKGPVPDTLQQSKSKSSTLFDIFRHTRLINVLHSIHFVASRVTLKNRQLNQIQPFCFDCSISCCHVSTNGWFGGSCWWFFNFRNLPGVAFFCGIPPWN